MDWLRKVLVAGWAVAALGGCSIYDSRYVFGPKPVDVESAVPGVSDVEPVRTLVSVIGVRRADQEAQRPASVEVRLRVENTSPASVTFDPTSLALFSADLKQFPAPIVEPPDPFDVEPQASAIVEAFFPFPDEADPADFDLSGLNVRWTMRIGGQPVTSSASFTRRREVYYPRHRFHFGIGYRFYCW